MIDDLRPKGTVQVRCRECGWHFWVECLDPRLPDGPFTCPECRPHRVLIEAMSVIGRPMWLREVPRKTADDLWVSSWVHSRPKAMRFSADEAEAWLPMARETHPEACIVEESEKEKP